MNYREALAWLFGTQLFGIKLGLDNIRRLLSGLDLPAKEQRIIHVAGTNGKGSVCAMIDAIVRAQGYRTGLFTSPHLVTFRERIQVGGEMISRAEVAAGLTSIRELIREWEPHPTFFEITTALGLDHFRAKGCELIVLETGMGGRLDATNAITPVVSVITPIALDHQKWLGGTLTEIAAEKAGIIKPGVPVVSACQPAEAAIVIERTAAQHESPLEVVSASYDKSKVALSGRHQRQNAALAVAALQSASVAVGHESIASGLANVTWPARFQRWDEGTVIDGAHNPAGAQVLADTWREQFPESGATIVLGMFRDKDVVRVVEPLTHIAQRFVLPPMRSERALPPAELAAIIANIAPAMCVTCVDSLPAALQNAASGDTPVLITGSLHFAGEVLALLRGSPDDLEDCLQ